MVSYRCGRTHEPVSCKFKDANCYNCNKKGYTAKKCCSARKKPTGSQEPGKNYAKRPPKERLKTNLVQGHAPDNNDVYAMYHLTSGQVKSFQINIELCEKTQAMEIDTGASKTILNEDTYNHFSQELGPLEETTALLSTYTGEEIPVPGEVLVPVKYGNQEHKLSAVVVRGNGPNFIT